MTDQDSRYFLSYSREDSSFALRLAKELRAAGAFVWVDQLDIVGGERWDEAVENALKRSLGLVFVLSPDAVESQNFMDEVSFALEKNKKVVPVLYRQCEIPFRLRRFQRVDLNDNYEAGFRQLCRALGVSAPDGAQVSEQDVPTHETPDDNEPKRRRQHNGDRVAPWRIAVLAASLAPYYLGVIAESCHNAEWAALSAIVGLPLALFIRRRYPRNFYWLLIPAMSAMIGAPHGHGFGTITRSPLFGFDVGEKCQTFAETYPIILGLLAAVAILDFFLVRRVYKLKH